MSLLKKRSSRMFTLLLMCFFSFSASAQIDINPDNVQDSKAVIVTTNDGSVIYGFLTNQTDDKVMISSVSLGDVLIDIKEISKIDYINTRNIKTDKNGFLFDYHNSTHHFVFPSGYNLKRGQSYFENIYIFYNSYTYGITDNISITGGLEIANLLFSARAPLIFLSGKFSVPFANDKAAIAVNATLLTIPSNNLETFAVLTGSFTFGTRNNNVTAGLGVGVRANVGINDEIVPFSISTMQRISKKISIVSENWFFVEDDFSNTFGLISLGVRVHFKDNGGSFNAGLFRPLDGGGFDYIGVPVVSAIIAIGK